MSGFLRRSRRALASMATGLVVVVAPRIAAACSVCMSGREDENRFAFIATTVFLSVLPLALIGGLGLYLRRRAREIEKSESRPGGLLDAAPSPR